MWIDKASESDNINDSNKNKMKRVEKVLKSTLKAIMGNLKYRHWISKLKLD